jgi:Tfp pilus assembly protein PilF
VDAAIQSALILMARGDTRNAHDVIRQAIQIDAASAKAYTIQARLHLIDNAPADAQAALRQAIKAGPDYAPAHLESGLLYVSRGVLAEGLRALERYMQLTAETGAAEDRAEIGTFVEQLRQTMQDERGPAQTGPAVQGGRLL